MKQFTGEMLSSDDVYDIVAKGPGVFPDFWTEDDIRAVIVSGANLMASRQDRPETDE